MFSYFTPEVGTVLWLMLQKPANNNKRQKKKTQNKKRGAKRG